jgi:hypothetical protein
MKHDVGLIVNALRQINMGVRVSDIARALKINDSSVRRWYNNGLEHYEKLLAAEQRLASFTASLSGDTPEPVLQEPPKAMEGFGKRIIVIGDMQVKPEIDLDYCRFIGQYCADKKPDVIVNIGDFADMPSLSTYETKGSKKHSSLRVDDDFRAVQRGMKELMTPIKDAMRTGWNPRLVMTLGNHEHRIDRAIELNPQHLEGKIHISDLQYEEWGWEVFPFLEPAIIDGIAFCHYFPSGQMGRPVTTARALLNKKHMSCIAGHQQGRDIAYGYRADGKEMTAIINGSSYEHDEDYLNYQTNNHFRGIYLLNDVQDGSFEECPVSMKFLRARYG